MLAERAGLCGRECGESTTAVLSLKDVPGSFRFDSITGTGPVHLVYLLLNVKVHEVFQSAPVLFYDEGP